MTAVAGRARYFVYAVATRCFLQVLSGVTGILISRILQPEGRGVYSVVVMISMTTMALGGLSLDKAHMTLWVRPENRVAVTANSAWAGMAVGVVSALVVAAGIVAGDHMGMHVVPASGLGPLAIALTAVPLGLTSLYLGAVLMLRGRTDLVNRGEFLGAVVQFGPLFLLAVTGWVTVTWVVAVWVLSTAVTVAVLYAAIRPRLRDADLRMTRRAVTMGIRYHPGLASTYLLRHGDILLLNALTTTRVVGLYSLAASLGGLTLLLTEAAAQVTLSRQMADEDDPTWAYTVQTTRISGILSLASVGSLCIAAPVAIPLVYGPSFGGSVAPLFGLAPGLLMLGATRPLTAYFLRLNRPLATSAVSLAALAVDLVLSVVLIPMAGAVGCAVASSIANATMAGVQVAWFARTTGISPRRLLPSPGDVTRLSRAVVVMVRARQLG